MSVTYCQIVEENGYELLRDKHCLALLKKELSETVLPVLILGLSLSPVFEPVINSVIILQTSNLVEPTD